MTVLCHWCQRNEAVTRIGIVQSCEACAPNVESQRGRYRAKRVSEMKLTRIRKTMDTPEGVGGWKREPTVRDRMRCPRCFRDIAATKSGTPYPHGRKANPCK